MKDKVSFITPVYNGENTLQKSVDSVLKEKEYNIELILVDDGSTDGTYDLCEKIASMDERVVVLHTKNQGTGLARATGMKASTGKYLTFVDADDVLVWDGMRDMIDAAASGDWDIVCGNYYMNIDGKITLGVTDLEEGEVKRTDEYGTLYQKIKTRSPFGYCANKLYKRSFLEENNLYIEDTRKVYLEDTLFNLKVFAKNPTYYFVKSPMFTYYIYEGSVSRKADKMIAEKFVTMFRTYMSYLETEGLTEENMDLAVPLAMRIFCWSVFSNIKYEGLDKELMKHRINVFLEDEYFSECVKNKKNRKYIGYIPSFPQRVMYSMCFDLLGAGKVNLLSFIFSAGYPAMSLYNKLLKVK